ncbi:MAG TPA: lysophospholipid acyltransferase family protein [Kofleriaceae bacterium]|nr:lysophospholipid acyltransferase family protein [Kofleriaceae bacterium]
MSLIDSVRVLGAMARITAPTLVDAARGSIVRSSIDDRARWFGRRVIELLDIQLTTSGADHVPPRAVVYMSNHQSHLDIPVLYATLPSPTIRMLAKTELFRIPLWGRGLRAAEFIEVDRSNHLAAVRSIDEAARLVRDGISIYLAPEGTRSRDGRIGKLKKGGFHLALATGAPLVPVAIRGTGKILPPGTLVMRTGQRVTVQIGAPIDVSGRDVPSLVTQVAEFLVKNVEN